MRVLICGAGQVGANIARYLADAGNDVTVVDQRADLVREIGETRDVKAVHGHGSHPAILQQAGADTAEILIAVTASDETNMIACQVAHSLFGVPTKIARVRQQDYLDERWSTLFDRDHLPIDVVISPEQEVARAAAMMLTVGGASDAATFVDGKIQLITVRCIEDCPVIDTPLRQLTYLFADLDVICIGVDRDGHFFVPEPDDQLLAGDQATLIVDARHVERSMRLFGHREPSSRRVVIVGGGTVGAALAARLLETRDGAKVQIIEASPARAEFLAEKLPGAPVFAGDARSSELLAEVGVALADAVVTVTNDDEANVMSGLLAKRLGCQRVLALINKHGYERLLTDIGVDVVINPRETTVSTVLRHVRRGSVRAVLSLYDGAAEVFEADALETSPLVGKPLREARLPSGVIVAAIVRDGETIRPRGETAIRAGDRVVVIAKAELVPKVEQLFAVRLDYF